MTRVSFCFLFLVACGSTVAPSGSDAAGGGGGETAAPAEDGTFAATYEVPVPDSLSAAATFTFDSLNWKVAADGSVRLAYNLPKDLVGKTISVELEGVLNADAQTAELSGSAGTASCALTASTVTCQEQLSGLAPIDSDLAVVEKLAARDFAGPSDQRVSVAQLFASEPIGIVYIDLTRTPN